MTDAPETGSSAEPLGLGLELPLPDAPRAGGSAMIDGLDLGLPLEAREQPPPPLVQDDLASGFVPSDDSGRDAWPGLPLVAREQPPPPLVQDDLAPDSGFVPSDDSGRDASPGPDKIDELIFDQDYRDACDIADGVNSRVGTEGSSFQDAVTSSDVLSSSAPAGSDSSAAPSGSGRGDSLDFVCNFDSSDPQNNSHDNFAAMAELQDPGAPMHSRNNHFDDGFAERAPPFHVDNYEDGYVERAPHFFEEPRKEFNYQPFKGLGEVVYRGCRAMIMRDGRELRDQDGEVYSGTLAFARMVDQRMESQLSFAWAASSHDSQGGQSGSH